MGPISWLFRAGGPVEQRPDLVLTRAFLADATRYPEAYLTPHLEALAAVGFLRKGKIGSRVVYTRPEECKIARPGLPEGWFWGIAITHPRGVRTVEAVIETGKIGPYGTSQC